MSKPTFETCVTVAFLARLTWQGTPVMLRVEIHAKTEMFNEVSEHTKVLHWTQNF